MSKEKQKSLILKNSSRDNYIETSEYFEIDTLEWKTLNGINIKNLRTYLESCLDKNSDNVKFIVSCDSQRIGKKIIYVTMIVFLTIGNGGRGFFIRELEEIENYVSLSEDNDKKSRTLKMQNIMRRRLWNECLKSVKCAVWLDKILSKYNLKVCEIHSDINTNKKYKSSELVQAIHGYVESCGYINILKPDAWAASSVANFKTK